MPQKCQDCSQNNLSLSIFLSAAIVQLSRIRKKSFLCEKIHIFPRRDRIFLQKIE